MSSISHEPSHLPDLKHLLQGPSFTGRTNKLQAEAQTSTHTNLSFVTMEGDRVSLSSRSEINTSIGTYTFQGFSERQGISRESQQFSTSIQENFNLLIEGDLNEQELADIQEFLKSSRQIVQELGGGDVEEAIKAANSLHSLDSLAQAALFTRKSTSVSLASQSTKLPVQEKADSHEALRGRSRSGLERLRSLENVFNKIRNAQKIFQLDPEQSVTRLPKLMSTIIDSLEQDKETPAPPPPIFRDIQKEFLESILESIKDVSRRRGEHDTLLKETTRETTVSPVIGQHTPDHTRGKIETMEETAQP